MKKLFTLLALIVITTINAQAPQGFNYQATVRNSSGALIVNQNVLFKFNIMLNSQTSLPVYSETHQVPTDDLGQVNLTVGTGTATTGTFAGINWANGTYYLGIELNTGTEYVAMGTTQLLSVPYALYANTAGSTSSNNTGLISPTITTNPVTNISGTTASFSASISNANINQLSTTAGFVYSLNPNPIFDIASSNTGNVLRVDLSSNTFTYDFAVQGWPNFLSNTLYYVRAFVFTENNTIVYGNEISFVTCPTQYAYWFGSLSIEDVGYGSTPGSGSANINGDCDKLIVNNDLPGIGDGGVPANLNTIYELIFTPTNPSGSQGTVVVNETIIRTGLQNGTITAVYTGNGTYDTATGEIIIDYSLDAKSNATGAILGNYYTGTNVIRLP
jgi:hypothetical protein